MPTDDAIPHADGTAPDVATRTHELVADNTAAVAPVTPPAQPKSEAADLVAPALPSSSRRGGEAGIIDPHPGDPHRSGSAA